MFFSLSLSKFVLSCLASFSSLLLHATHAELLCHTLRMYVWYESTLPKEVLKNYLKNK